MSTKIKTGGINILKPLGSCLGGCDGERLTLIPILLYKVSVGIIKLVSISFGKVYPLMGFDSHTKGNNTVYNRPVSICTYNHGHH